MPLQTWNTLYYRKRGTARSLFCGIRCSGQGLYFLVKFRDFSLCDFSSELNGRHGHTLMILGREILSLGFIFFFCTSSPVFNSLFYLSEPSNKLHSSRLLKNVESRPHDVRCIKNTELTAMHTTLVLHYYDQKGYLKIMEY